MNRFIGFVVAIAVGGAILAAAWKNRGDPFERTVKESMRARMGVEITALTLNGQPDGGRTGTATTADDETYTVTITPPAAKGQVEWKAIPSQATLEKRIRNHIKTASNTDVQELRLRELVHGYEGAATTTDGRVYDLVIDAPDRDGKFAIKIIPGRVLIEKGLREHIEARGGVAVESLELEKQTPGYYNGTAVLADGSKLRITTVETGGRVEWTLTPAR